MKNIKKLGIALTFIAFSSVACSTNSTEEISSNPSPVIEDSANSTEEVSEDISSVMEDANALTEEVSENISSAMEDANALTEEVSENISSAMEDTGALTEEVSENISSAMEDASALTEEVSEDISSIIENPVVGTKVTLRGNIIEQMEDCYIFSDGDNKIMVHFEEEILSYDPNTVVEISGIVEEGKLHESDHLEGKNKHDSLADTMIMVEEMQVIASNKQ